MIQVSFAGNLVRDPEVKQGKESQFTSFSVAVTHGAKDGQDGKVGTEFVECLAGGKTGENIAKYFKKGDQIVVYGSVYKTDAWVGKKDNQPHASISVRVANFDFGRRKSAEAGSSGSSASGAPGLSDDDIPF